MNQDSEGVPPLVGLVAITGTVVIMVASVPLVVGNMCYHLGRELLDEALDAAGRAVDKRITINR